MNRFVGVRFFAAVSLVAAALPVSAQTAARVMANQSTVTVVDDTLILTRIPIVYGEPGQERVRFQDIRVKLAANATNGVIRSATVIESANAARLATGFIPGRYRNLLDGCEFIVNGPGEDSGGRTSWSISSIASKCSNDQLSGGWQTGPVVGHRDQLTIQDSGCAAEGSALAYGIIGGGDGYFFDEGNLLRASRNGNGLTLEDVSPFTSSCEVDQAITLTLCPGGDCAALD